MNGEFKVNVGDFEGPMDILLRLIEERKLHISQVSLAAVADNFIAYMQTLDAGRKGELANFILIAATLMLIKSRSLLPTLEVTPEEQESMAELEQRLKLYQETKRLADGLRKLFGRQIIFSPEAGRQRTPVFAPTPEVTPGGLLAALREALKNLPQPEKIPQVVVKKVLSLEEAIGNLTTRVQTALRLSFRQFVGSQKDKVNIIVSFLGLLELVKQGIVAVEQSAQFDDIQIESTETGVPKYL
jgi:segregation and condensation protein A